MNTPAAIDWPAQCAARGLLMTAPRRAILAALAGRDRADDAVILLQAACERHPATRIGTVYRFLRELERAGLARAEAAPHQRARWQLCAPAPVDAAGDAELRQVRDFLRELDRLGLVEALPKAAVSQTPASETSEPRVEAGLALLAGIAERLGYRLTPNPPHSPQGSP